MMQITPEDYVKIFGNAYPEDQFEMVGSPGGLSNYNYQVYSKAPAPQPQPVMVQQSPWLNPNFIYTMMMFLLFIVVIVAIVILVRESRK